MSPQAHKIFKGENELQKSQNNSSNLEHLDDLYQHPLCSNMESKDEPNLNDSDSDDDEFYNNKNNSQKEEKQNTRYTIESPNGEAQSVIYMHESKNNKRRTKEFNRTFSTNHNFDCVLTNEIEESVENIINQPHQVFDSQDIFAE